MLTSEPDSPEREVSDEPLDTNRPVALSGDTHEHLENQQIGESKSNKSPTGKRSKLGKRGEGLHGICIRIFQVWRELTP